MFEEDAKAIIREYIVEYEPTASDFNECFDHICIDAEEEYYNDIKLSTIIEQYREYASIIWDDLIIIKQRLGLIEFPPEVKYFLDSI